MCSKNLYLYHANVLLPNQTGRNDKTKVYFADDYLGKDDYLRDESVKTKRSCYVTIWTR